MDGERMTKRIYGSGVEGLIDLLIFGHRDPAMGAGAHSPPVIPDLHQVVWCSMAQVLL